MESTTIIFILIFLLLIYLIYFNTPVEKFKGGSAGGHGAVAHSTDTGSTHKPIYTYHNCYVDGDHKAGIISGCCNGTNSKNQNANCIVVPGCPNNKLSGCNNGGGGGGGSGGAGTACFAGSELILLENGQYKKISEISIGDIILTADKNYNLSYSPVIFLPHEQNNIKTQFIQITSNKNNTIKLTPEHNIIANDKVVYASKVNIGDILQTINGPEIVKDISIVTDFGIYTIITENEFIIVNNIIASSIAYVSHEEGMEFYKLLKDIRCENLVASDDIHNIAHELFNYTYLQ